MKQKKQKLEPDIKPLLDEELKMIQHFRLMCNFHICLNQSHPEYVRQEHWVQEAFHLFNWTGHAVSDALPFGGAAVAAFTRAWVAAAADGGVAIGISVTGRGRRPSGPK